MLQIDESFAPLQSVEVRSALDAPQKGKAPGPDGYVVEIYRNLPRLLDLIAQLYNIAAATARIPLHMRKLTIAQPDKPSRNPELCKSTRPASLPCVLAKALEVTVLRRMQCNLERGLDCRQHAYRQSRGTETHLVEIFDSMKEARDRGRYFFVARR